jgi:hypothetical protein
MWGQSSPSSLTPFPCIIISTTIWFTTSITFFTLPDHCVFKFNSSIQFNSYSIEGVVLLTRPLKNIEHLVDWNKALTRSCKVAKTIFVFTFGPFLVDCDQLKCFDSNKLHVSIPSFINKVISFWTQSPKWLE